MARQPRFPTTAEFWTEPYQEWPGTPVQSGMFDDLIPKKPSAGMT
jgi:hypothetical protein